MQPTTPQDTRDVILAIGQLVGAVVSETGTTPRLVRRGVEIHELDDDRFAVWGLAHGTPASVRSGRLLARQDVEDLAAAAGVPAADTVMDELLAVGLIVAVVPGADGSATFARTHRVCPLMMGLGNSAGEPGRFGIGFAGRPVVQLDYAMYDVWLWSAVDDTLWQTCNNAATSHDPAGEAAVGAERLVEAFTSQLPGLLLTGACYLDIPFRLDRPHYAADVA